MGKMHYWVQTLLSKFCTMFPTCVLTFQGLVFFNWKLAVPYGTRSPYVTRLKRWLLPLLQDQVHINLAARFHSTGLTEWQFWSSSLEVVNECNVVGRYHLLVRSSVTQAWQIWAAFKGIWTCLLVLLLLLLLLVFGSEIASGMTKVCASSSLNFTTTDPGISASFRVTRPSLSSPAYLDNMYFDIKASCLPSCIWSGTVIDTAKLPMRFSFITYFLNRVSESGGKLEWKQTVATSLGIGYSARNSRRLS